MAERRMFAKTIIDSDAFIDMPISARLLYYDLSMRADDDGFINSPKKIVRMIGASDDDIKLLIAKKFIIPFENGVVVIKHWKIHNYIRKDTYKPTNYKEQLSTLTTDENNAYTQALPMPVTGRIESVDEPWTQVRLGKDRIGKNNKEKESDKKESLTDLIDESTLPDPVKEGLKEWLAYKQERKEPYKPIGFKKLITEVKNRTEKHGGFAVVGAMEKSMANNWKGIIWDVIEKPQQDKGGGLPRW